LARLLLAANGQGKEKCCQAVSFTWPWVEFLLPLWFGLYNNSEMSKRSIIQVVSQMLIAFPVVQMGFSGSKDKLPMSQRRKMCKKSFSIHNLSRLGIIAQCIRQEKIKKKKNREDEK